MAIFRDMVEQIIKVFMDDFLVFGPSFDTCLHNLNLVLQRCEGKFGHQLGEMSFYGEGI